MQLHKRKAVEPLRLYDFILVIKFELEDYSSTSFACLAAALSAFALSLNSA